MLSSKPPSPNHRLSSMKYLCLTLGGILMILSGCGQSTTQVAPAGSPDATASLTEARKGFQTKLVRREAANEPVETPPPQVFQLVQYESPAGKLAAYLTPDPGDGKQHPAIVWITGGDCNTIGDLWSGMPENNDQTAAAYRNAGIVMMFPSLRGGNMNPGFREGFFGEVDDVLAAADYLARQSYVDPQRVYLGGHSTGGTLVLLTAASTDRFRAVFSFGPVEDVGGYGSEYCPFDLSSARELELRAPIRWLHSIKSPVFVFEGVHQGNLDSLRSMAQASKNPLAHFHEVPGKDHFSVLAPTNRLIAGKIVTDTGPTTNLSFSEQELSGR